METPVIWKTYHAPEIAGGGVYVELYFETVEAYDKWCKEFYSK